MTIPSDLEIIFSHHHRRQVLADSVPPIRGLLFKGDAQEPGRSAEDPARPLPIDELLQDSIPPVDVVYGFKIRF